MGPASVQVQFEEGVAGLSRRVGVMLGCSGGADSMALLHLAVGAGFRRIVVCHLDHRLRGRESAQDARFVRREAERLGCEAEVGSEDVGARAVERGMSLEAAGREARYRFFADVARRRGLRTLLLGHQADDRVETFLFNLLRGAGVAGLTSLRRVSLRREAGVRLRVVRPLLGVWRRDLAAWLTAGRRAWREDSSNADAAFGRNRMRLRILPFLEGEFGRDVRGAIWRTAELLAAEDEWMEAACGRVGRGRELSVAALRALPLALCRRAVRAWLLGRGVPDVGFREVESVRALAVRETPARVNLAGGIHARRRAGRIFLEASSGRRGGGAGGEGCAG